MFGQSIKVPLSLLGAVYVENTSQIVAKELCDSGRGAAIVVKAAKQTIQMCQYAGMKMMESIETDLHTLLCCFNGVWDAIC
jgi:hypothetical protein